MLSEISEPKPLDQEPATTEPDSQIALPQMMPQQRIIELRQRFAKKSVPLPRALTPTLCNIYPDLADEIIGAYLEHTTFVVKVWVNYDAAWKKFFVDGRFHDCGRVIVNAKESLLLQGLAANDVQMTRVRFEIGSAFRPFCTSDRSDSFMTEALANMTPIRRHPCARIIRQRRATCTLQTSGWQPSGADDRPTRRLCGGRESAST